MKGKLDAYLGKPTIDKY